MPEDQPRLLDLAALANRSGLELTIKDPATLQRNADEARHQRRMEIARLAIFAPGLIGLATFLCWVVGAAGTNAELKSSALTGLLAVVSGVIGFLGGKATK